MRFNVEEEASWCKTFFKKFPEAGLVTTLYFLDVITDIFSTVKLWRAEQINWFIMSCCFMLTPELGIGIYIAIRLYKDNVKTRHNRNIKEDLRIFGFVDRELNRTKGNLLLLILFLVTPLMVLPFIMLPFLSYKSYKALKKNSAKDKDLALAVIYELMKIKTLEAIFQSVPQLCLSSYIVLHTMHCDQLELTISNATNVSFCSDVNDFQEYEDIDYLVTFVSALVSLTTLCFSVSGFEYEKKTDTWRRTGFFPAFFLAIGARITVCGVMGSWHRALWFAPPAAACLISFLGLLITRKLAKEPVFVFDLDLLSHVLFGGLLLAIPTIDGILVCFSYIGWAAWFYVKTDVDIRYEALAATVIMQTISMAFVFILRSFGYNVLFFRRNTEKNKDNELQEFNGNEMKEVQEVYAISPNINTNVQSTSL